MRFSPVEMTSPLWCAGSCQGGPGGCCCCCCCCCSCCGCCCGGGGLGRSWRPAAAGGGCGGGCGGWGGGAGGLCRAAAAFFALNLFFEAPPLEPRRSPGPPPTGGSPPAPPPPPPAQGGPGEAIVPPRLRQKDLRKGIANSGMPPKLQRRGRLNAARQAALRRSAVPSGRTRRRRTHLLGGEPKKALLNGLPPLECTRILNFER